MGGDTRDDWTERWLARWSFHDHPETEGFHLTGTVSMKLFRKIVHTLHVDRLDSDEVTIIVPAFRRGRAILAMCHGDWNRAGPILVRIQSRCAYGEVLGSCDCDCREQLDKAQDMIAREGAGILIYLEQEGRGAGLLAKARGYAYAQRNGVDTFTAYRALGLQADQRKYGAATRLLRKLGVTSVRLLTNNPEKLRALEEAGFEVKREALIIPPTERTRGYLESKRRRRGHLLEERDDQTILKERRS